MAQFQMKKSDNHIPEDRINTHFRDALTDSAGGKSGAFDFSNGGKADLDVINSVFKRLAPTKEEWQACIDYNKKVLEEFQRKKDSLSSRKTK